MKIEKRNTFTNDVIFIDGLWGTGKSLLGPVVSGMSNVDRVKIDVIYENISRLYQLEKIERDAAIWLIKTYADKSLYYNSIGREINLRWEDDTGLKYAPDKFGALLKLFAREGDPKVREITERNVALCVMSHMLMLAPGLLEEAFGRRLKLIEVVRHPLFMIEHFEAFLDRFDNPREFTPSIYENNIKMPWFAWDFRHDYLDANSLERTMLCIVNLYRQLSVQLQNFRRSGNQILDISFEQMVFETSATMSRLEIFTGRKHNSNLAMILKKQRLPRKTLTEGRGHRSYGWRKTQKTDAETFQGLMSRIRLEARREILSEFLDVIEWYDSKYPSELKNLV